MKITTETPESRRNKIKLLREFHQDVLDSINESDAVFIPKMAYKPIGKNELHVGFFENEINKGVDVYLEFCSRENEPEDVNRTLYKYINNPHFKEEYDTTEPSQSTGHVRYLVPVAELKIISSYDLAKSNVISPTTHVSEKQEQLKFDLPDAETDLPMDQMTIRDYAAIHLNKPVSHKEWLNQIIDKK